MWLVILMGIGKEIFDLFNGGTVEIWDAIATIFGGLLMYLLVVI